MEFVLQGATRLLIAEDIAEGAVSYLGESLGIRQIGYRDWITARAPDDHEQRFFGISHDLTVFELFRTAFDQNKKPMRVTVTVYPTDRNQFIVNVGRCPGPPVRRGARRGRLRTQASHSESRFYQLPVPIPKPR